MSDPPWNALYTRQLVDAIRPELHKLKFPWELAKHLNERLNPAFSDIEMDCLKACWDRKEVRECTDKLLDFIQSKPDWFNMLCVALRSEHILSSWVADALVGLKDTIDRANGRIMGRLDYPSEALLHRAISDWQRQEEQSQIRDEEMASLRANAQNMAGQIAALKSIICTQLGVGLLGQGDAKPGLGQGGAVKPLTDESVVTFLTLGADMENISKTVGNLGTRLRKNESDTEEHSTCLRDMKKYVSDNQRLHQKQTDLEAQVASLKREVNSTKRRLDGEAVEMKTGLKKLKEDAAALVTKTDELAGDMRSLEQKTVRQKVHFGAILSTTQEPLTIGTRLDRLVVTLLNKGGVTEVGGRYKLPLEGDYFVYLRIRQVGDGEMMVAVSCNEDWIVAVLKTSGDLDVRTGTLLSRLKKDDELGVEVFDVKGTAKIGFCRLTVYRLG